MPDNMSCAVSTNEQVPVPAGDGSWMGAVEAMGAWYMAYVTTYWHGCSSHCGDKIAGSRKTYDCPMLGSGGKVGDDCSSFVTACLSYFNQAIWPGSATGWPRSTDYANENSSICKKMKENGFTYIPFNYNILQRGDIISKANSHVEIVEDPAKNKAWSWGNVRNGKQRPSTCCQTGIAGKVNSGSENMKTKGYTAIWRYTGKTSG